jgi:hypothetical protein
MPTGTGPRAASVAASPAITEVSDSSSAATLSSGLGGLDSFDHCERIATPAPAPMSGLVSLTLLVVGRFGTGSRYEVSPVGCLCREHDGTPDESIMWHDICRRCVSPANVASVFAAASAMPAPAAFARAGTRPHALQLVVAPTRSGDAPREELSNPESVDFPAIVTLRTTWGPVAPLTARLDALVSPDAGAHCVHQEH